MSTFFVILALVMQEIPVYQNLSKLSIRKSKVNFLLTELTQLLEACGVEITSLYLERQHEEWIDIVLTIDSQDLKHLLPTLRRFSYEVMSKHKEDDLEDKLKEHASYLDKYLSM
ncbi:hypothetical protein OA336_01555 [Flavobacteriaceae bacterium]|nr:hypothetical protein [Flavobacteriaceae bacterium]